VHLLVERSHALSPFLRKLESHVPLSASDREAILGLPHRVNSFQKGAYLFREGERSSYSCAIVSGFAVRHKITGEGGRQILAVHMAGDGWICRTPCWR
jgi:CRP-like cAMP-binding protein